MSDPTNPGNDQQGAPTPEPATTPGPAAANEAPAAQGEPEIPESQLKAIIAVLQSRSRHAEEREVPASRRHGQPP